MENMTEEHKKNILDLFVEGARKGFTIGTTSLLPNVIMAFVIIRILDVTGLLHLIGVAFQPIMGLWGLPGEAATVIIGSLMSMGGAIGILMSLFTQGIMDPIQVTVMVHYDLLNKHPAVHLGYAFNHALLLNVVEKNCNRRTDLLWKIQNHFLNF